MPISPAFQPSAAHATLGPDFFDPVDPARFPQHILRYRNDAWAARVGLDGLNDTEWLRHFAGFEPLPGSLERPLALRYHGHQFRSYNPELGDGRGFLYAQLRDLRDGRLLDLGTKGSGQTPWSRFGDGRLTLKGGVRELLASSLLEALGVDTSKTFSLVETGEALQRNDEPSPTRSAVLVRLSHSHIRIGTFQRFAALGETANIERLLLYAIETYLPGCARPSTEESALAFLAEVCRRVARTGAQWMLAGFVHGVLNTDNINITGESFDYGPWRFLPVYEPGFTAAYFDQTGLYAYGRQPDTLLWNLTRLAECLLPLAPKERVEEALGAFQGAFNDELLARLLARLGLASAGPERDVALARAFFTAMKATQAPFERVFYDWFGGEASAGRAAASPSAPAYAQDGFRPLLEAMEGYRVAEGAKLDHPYFGRGAPCTMLIEEVEAIWAPIAERDDWSALDAKFAEIRLLADALAPAAGA